MEEKDITINSPEERVPRGLLEKSASLLSMLLTPFTIPTLSFLLLFYGTYLRVLPHAYKLSITGIIFCFTWLAPLLAIGLLQRMHGEGFEALQERKKRFFPYLICILSHLACLIIMYRLHMPRYMSGVIESTLLGMILCIFINFKWRISTHTAGIGILIGNIWAYSLLFHFNPLIYFCPFILLAGMTGTARIIVGQHTLSEVFAGFIVGMFCGITGILFI